MQLKHATAFVWFALISISLIGCWRNQSPISSPRGSGQNKSPAEEAASTADESTIDRGNEDMASQRQFSLGSFRGRDHTITIYSTSDGPRFTVTTADGKVLAEKLSVGDIQAKLPDIYKTYENTFAAQDNYLDARAELAPMVPPSATGSRHLDAGIGGRSVGDR